MSDMVPSSAPPSFPGDRDMGGSPAFLEIRQGQAASDKDTSFAAVVHHHHLLMNRAQKSALLLCPMSPRERFKCSGVGRTQGKSATATSAPQSEPSAIKPL